MPRRDFYGAQSTLPAAAKEAFVRRVLFDVGGFALFRRVVMMFWMFHGLIFRRLRIAPRAFFRAIGGRNRRHVTGTHETLQAEVKICGRERAPVAEGCCV